MVDQGNEGWLTSVQGVVSDASIDARIRRHWSDDAALLARATRRAPAKGAPFDVAMRDFDRLIGAA